MQKKTKLSQDERIILFAKMQLGLTIKVLAQELGRKFSSIYREICRNKSQGKHMLLLVILQQQL